MPCLETTLDMAPNWGHTGPMMTRYGLRINTENYEKAKQIAREDGRSLNAWINRLIHNAITQHSRNKT